MPYHTSKEGSTLRKLIDFKELKNLIQAYADEHCEGNFNMAVRKLIKQGLLS